jgi:hypothetical protein
MFTISVETQFRASHRLVRTDGSKERPHSHEWSVTAEVSAETLDSRTVVMDFHQLKAVLLVLWLVGLLVFGYYLVYGGLAKLRQMYGKVKQTWKFAARVLLASIERMYLAKG